VPFGANDKYAIADLDEFLRRLTRDAELVRQPSRHQVPIPVAAKRACCSAAAIVRLVIDRKLTRVGKLRGVRGYLGVLVDVTQIKAEVRGPDTGGLPLRMVCRELRTTDRVVDA
jgi:hypothetical protein